MNSIFDNPATRMMYQNALADLANGVISPLTQDVLSYTPLPNDVVDPYVSRTMEARSTMDLAYSSLSVWTEEAKKANYFTKHFVTLSRMINTGVATMARGLATLHAFGEDLSDAPMSIQDLIMVASYHFRKSYLGVLQTSRSHPEIGERLLMNQLSWADTLMRLFKTKDKLSKKAAVIKQDAEITVSGEAAPSELKAPDREELPDGDIQPMAGFSAVAAPGAYGAVRAYAPISQNQKPDKTGTQSIDPEEDLSEESDLEVDAEEAASAAVCDEPEETADSNVSMSGVNGPAMEEGPVTMEDDVMPCAEDPPAYYRILYEVERRSMESGEEGLTFTDEEVRELLADPEFCLREREMAFHLRKLLSGPEPRTA